MKFPIKKVGFKYLETAPALFINRVDINASSLEVFNSFADEKAWTTWFPDIVGMKWTCQKPYGVGSSRTVNIKAMTGYERIIAWDPGKRFTFYLKNAKLELDQKIRP